VKLIYAEYYFELSWVLPVQFSVPSARNPPVRSHLKGALSYEIRKLWKLRMQSSRILSVFGGVPLSASELNTAK